MTEYKPPRVYTVQPGQDFLPVIAAALCEGTLVPGFAYNGDPLSLARATIFVPTRRAARELRSAFMDHLGSASVLLPKIRPLGEFDEEDLLFESGAEDFTKILPPIDSLERQLILGSLIAQWSKHLTSNLRALYGEEELTTPVSTADAFWMARDLAGLLDQLQTEDLDFSQVDAASQSDVSEWWGVTLAFLKIIRTQWPKILAERSRIDPAAHRNLMLRGEAKRLEQASPVDPVIVAGSTGTIPATSDLISTVAKLPGGAVVLPGYDLAMDQATIQALDKPDDVASAIGHPQFGLQKLVRKISAFGLVEPLGTQTVDALSNREKWVTLALAPAPCTSDWVKLRSQFDNTAFSNVAILNATNERQEAASIACALREAIADPNTTTALVTPDRMLARRVVAELARFGIEADDSGGSSFDATSHGSLLAFTFSLIFQPSDAASVLALLKNPLVQLGADAQVHVRQLAWLEKLILRGGVGRFTMDNFAHFCTDQLKRFDDEKAHKPSWAQELTEDDCTDAMAIANRLQNAMQPLAELAGFEKDVTIKQALEATVKTLEALSSDEAGNHSALYDGEAGMMLRAALTKFLQSETELMFEPEQWPEIIRAITSGLLVKPQQGGHPRVSIWGALEARLQSVDFLVLGGLNEGTWPQQTSNDAFLTRGMKSSMDMQPPERRIGLAAHDFQMAMGQKRVLLTRSKRVDNAPTVASRWLQRMETLAGSDAVKTLHSAGEKWQQIAQLAEKIKPLDQAERPLVTPPVDARPSHFSVTEIERLRRDPYAIYAKKILRLREQEKLTRDPDAAERGTIIHKIMELITYADLDFDAEDIRDQIEAIANQVFAEAKLPDDIDIVWRARFDALIDSIVAWESSREQLGIERYAEIKAKRIAIDDTDVTLGGIPDRLDIHPDGNIDIVDFKTGGAPSGKQVRALLAPQMPLEVAMMKRGAFDGIEPSFARDLLYITLGARGNLETRNVCMNGKKRVIEADELGQRAWDKLVDIMKYYADKKNGYISRAVPALQHDYGNEYDHLARVMEWSAGVEGDDVGGDER